MSAPWWFALVTGGETRSSSRSAFGRTLTCISGSVKGDDCPLWSNELEVTSLQYYVSPLLLFCLALCTLLWLTTECFNVDVMASSIFWRSGSETKKEQKILCKVVPHSEDHPKIDRFGIWPKITFGKSIYVHLPAYIEYIPSENVSLFCCC